MKKLSTAILSLLGTCAIISFVSCNSTKKSEDAVSLTIGGGTATTTTTTTSTTSTAKPAAPENPWITYTIDSTEKCGCFYTSGELGLYEMLEVEFKKTSGYEDGCFGLVFGYTSQNEGIVADYIRFEINTLGEYALYVYDGERYIDLIDATAENTAYLLANSNLKKGFGAINRLKVAKNTKGAYDCYINGKMVVTGVYPLEMGTEGFMVCYSVGKEEQENFPDTPVNFAYRIVNSKKVEPAAEETYVDF